MTPCLFVSDLHGRVGRYLKLFKKIEHEKPDAVFLGGDLLPIASAPLLLNGQKIADFTIDFLIPGFQKLKRKLGSQYPRVFLILGNDDPRIEESKFIEAESLGVWEYIHNKKTAFKKFTVYGYAYVPPTPFQLKDWERYDVSRYVDPGCVSPEEGARTVPVPNNHIKFATIKDDLEKLCADDDLSQSILLFHSPPYNTKLDRLALSRKMIDYVPLDTQAGSIAIKRFIKNRHPLLTLHGHIHESARMSGSWQDQIGITQLYSAAHDGQELALIYFDPEFLKKSKRELI